MVEEELQPHAAGLDYHVRAAFPDVAVAARDIRRILGESLLDFTRERVAYPRWLGYLPAFAFYVFMIWVELFSVPNPRTLGQSLAVYTIINIVAAWLFAG